MRIDGVTTAGTFPLTKPEAGSTRAVGFEELLRQTASDANGNQLAVEQSIQAMASGQEVDPATYVNAVNKADLAFRTLIQVRNRLVEAYDQLRQLQI